MNFLISSQDVVRVTVEQANDPLWLTLLGNGGVGVVLAAVVAWIVSRAGRKRSDLEHWRDARHEAYSEILVKVDSLVKDVALVTMPQIGMTNEEKQDALNRIFVVTDQMAPEVTKVRLMGYPDVHRHLSAVHVNAQFLRARIGREPDAAQEVRNEVVHHALSLENAMRKQLGLKGTLKQIGLWQTLRMNRGWWRNPVENRMFLPILFRQFVLRRNRIGQ